MPPKSKSLFRQPGVQHYQLVHRSQRDPLINDPDAGGRVLKELDNPNRKVSSTTPPVLLSGLLKVVRKVENILADPAVLLFRLISAGQDSC